MLISKLTLPLLGPEGIVKKTTKVYIATAAISEQGFGYIFGPNRLPTTATCQMITGLHLLTPPTLLRKILNSYSSTITLKIYRDNFFHPKVYIFDLEDGTCKAFVGSGNFSEGGFHKHEELFYVVTEPSECSKLKSWFQGYFQKSLVLTESLINKYEPFYHSCKGREEENNSDWDEFHKTISSSFDWNRIEFADQYFTRDDYFTFELSKSRVNNDEVRQERLRVKRKMLDLHDSIIGKFPRNWALNEHYEIEHIVSSLDPNNHDDYRLRAMWLAYGRSKNELKRYGQSSTPLDFIRQQIIIRQNFVGVWLMPGKPGGSKFDRDAFKEKMRTDVDYREEFYKKVVALGIGYWIDVAGITKEISSFKNSDELWDHTKEDRWTDYYFTIGRNYIPGSEELSKKNIVATVTKEFEKLNPLYHFMKDSTFA